MERLLGLGRTAGVWTGALIQGAQNYLPPPAESKIELWVPKSTVDTQILENTEEIVSKMGFAGLAKVWALQGW